MTEFAIRRATDGDLETIVDFNARLAEESEGLLLDRATLRNGVQGVLSHAARGSYYVAYDGGIVGQMMHTREWSDWRNGRHLPERVRASRPPPPGVCRSLYAHLKGLAAADPAVVGLRLYVERGNAAAQATYAGLGMQHAGLLGDAGAAR